MAEDKRPAGNVNPDFNNASTGLNQDNTLNQIKKGSLTYALNAAIENYDSNSVNYQNEPGNTACVEFPANYVLIGDHFIPEKNKQIYFLANPTEGYSLIGYMENNDCIFKCLASAACLNFSIDTPIHKVAHKVTNFGTEIYWADNNGRRYLNIDDVPKPLKASSSLCDPIYSNIECDVDCDKIKLQPDFSIPLLSVINILSGGDIKAGTVQFAVQYSDAMGNPYTSYYGVTNPTPIADTQLVTVNFDYLVGKSIVVDIQNLDVTGQFQYFNLAVIKTVNAISTPELVGTYFIDRNNKQITYTGQNKTNIQLAIEDIFEQFPYYDNANSVTSVQDILVWHGMTAADRLNYQSIASYIDVQWETHRIPAGENYSDELLATNYRGYMRDEVYALEVSFLLTSGKETDGFHIPGRKKSPTETAASPISKEDPDFIGNVDEGMLTAAYWKIYNTATVVGTHPSYTTDIDYKGPYQYGSMAYWESSEEYPCNEDIWGDLGGEKIRHHKFPDNLVSPIFETDAFPGKDGLISEDKAIFPIGIKIATEQIERLIINSDLTQGQKDDIVGFKILRGDRGVNKSVVAKGMLRNVNKYTREDQDFYYPNYPYNDLQEDPFLNTVNNAWTDLCETYIIELDPISNGDIVTVNYIDCNNNKSNIKEYINVGPHELCSIGVPTIVVPATGSVSEPNYEKWEAWVDQSDGFLGCGGFRVYWIKPDGKETSDFVFGWGLNQANVIKMNVKIGTTPYPNPGSDTCGKTIEYIETIQRDVEINCKIETAVSPITSEEELNYRQVFNSPDTSFGQPFLGTILKLENVIYGTGSAHFVEVKNNAKYRLLTAEAQVDALFASEKLARITTPFNYGAMYSAYQAYLQIYINGITRKNYGYSFNSVASYNYFKPIPNDLGIKQRTLDIRKYLIPAIQNVGEEKININNYNRETSVYLRTKDSKTNDTSAFPVPSDSPEMLSTGLMERSRLTISSSDTCSTPEKEQPIEVVSYYGSLKNDFINQWGQIYSYDTIDTGHTVIFGKEGFSQDTVFGGDTFIGKFAYKTKVPFFIDNRVGAPDDSDIFYDEIGNIAYPKYWHSARSILTSFGGEEVTMYNMISRKAHVFDCPNEQGPSTRELFETNSDPADNPNRTFYDGNMYMFAYGIPSFYCESSYNMDLRTAFNNREGDFWPHVSNGIPDDWVQEDYVSILNDNTYNYNTTFSKQNKESAITHLPEDWTVDYKNTNYPFRAIYSDIQNTDADNRVNNWLIYRALSYFDFPQNFGNLIALDGLANKAILARFENKSLLYNALVTIDTSNPQAAYVGNPRLFSNPPIDYADTDLGYIGSQHKMLLKIPQGAVFADAKRGQIFLVNGTTAVDLTAFGSGMNRFFTDHLAFEVLKHFPDINVDNNFKGIGLHGVYDSKYERIIITKLDYIPLYDTITLEDGRFYNTTDVKREVFLLEQEFFCNKSYTISFNFNTNSWVSFHSYLPNYYIGENNYFYSGLNYCPNDFDVLVGIMSPTFNTTTTTTTRVVQITTSTTTTERIVDCGLAVEITEPLCDLEGTGVVMAEADTCTRPMGMQQFYFISGYDTINPITSIDSTIDFAGACSNITLFSDFGNPEYTAQTTIGETAVLSLDSKVYLYNDSNDCTFIPDGWYFTPESAITTEVYHIVDGVIIEINNCLNPV